VISRYCHDLAVAFNSFYERVKVLDLADKNLVESRLCLVHSVKITIERALDLLGIVAPDRM
jgi:arginyl-tRNA synthetase